MPRKKTKKRRSPITKKGYNRGRQPANAGQTYPPEVLTPDETKALLQACSYRAPTGIRNRALIATSYRAGLRISELLALYPKDINAKKGTITVLRAKGRRHRVVGMDPEGFAILQRWLDRRKALKLTRRQPVFCTLDGRSLYSSYVRQLLPRLACKAGIEKRVHPHGLRHTHAAELAAEGVPLNIIQAQLGHSNAATTSRYLEHIAPTQVIEAMKKRRWEV